ncbi:hypothetical protein PCL_10524 [Purpureocillium lilacinum]|uniref:Mitochondrial division protein 1 n=1 Tax=Purpureocillium lilacinum TaxID=33203 RepID=A0A2U3DQ65_PURLI|nr:hypothetical protein PCL_10524 [Purpureocillium lilacinum]
MPVAVARRRKVKSRCLLVKAFWILRFIIECANSCFDEGLECLTDLCVTDPRNDKKRIEDTKGGLLEGSYKWILAHPDYLRWRDDDQTQARGTIDFSHNTIDFSHNTIDFSHNTIDFSHNTIDFSHNTIDFSHNTIDFSHNTIDFSHNTIDFSHNTIDFSHNTIDFSHNTIDFSHNTIDFSHNTIDFSHNTIDFSHNTIDFSHNTIDFSHNTIDFSHNTIDFSHNTIDFSHNTIDFSHNTIDFSHNTIDFSHNTIDFSHNTIDFSHNTGTESSLNNAVAVLRGLIFLLAAQQPSLVSHLRDKYNHSGPKLFEGANAFFALSDILSGMLRDPSLARAYVVIDALDECQTDLQRLLKLIVQNTSASRVKWIVSSRNRPDIEHELKPNNTQTRLSLELKANAEHVSHAVRVFINEKVSQLQSLQDDDELREKAAEALRQKAEGTFLWVALVVQELQNVKSHHVLAVLEEMPTGLGELYGRMMKQIQRLKRSDPELCWLVLSAAILAYRPLHILELGLLSGLPDEISSKAERVQAIIKMCGSLLTVRDDRVYIIHQSAKDYLSGEAASTMFPSGLEEAHHGIFLRSLHSMRCSLRRDIYGLRHPGLLIDDLKIPDPDPMASLRYSCVRWVDHLCEAQRRDDLTDGGPVHEFLECYLLYWIEALCLCNAMSDGVFAMAKLEMLLKTERLQKQERVQKSQRLLKLRRLLKIQRPPKTLSIDSALASLTLDAHRFLLYGLGMKNAPLQTYVSALLFSPAASSTRELFKKEAPQWVVSGPRVDERWSPLVHTLEGHDELVTSVAFSTDGKLLASASFDRTVKVWDAATGDIVRTLEAHSYHVRSVAFSPDGKLLASASDDRTLKVWDAATGEVQQTLEGHRKSVKSVAFSPDGKLLASASSDGIVKVWNAATGDIVRTLQAQSYHVRSVAFSPDGKLLASASYGGTVEVWDAATGDLVRTLKGHGQSWFILVAYSHNKKLLALQSKSKTVKVWDAATGNVVRTLKSHGKVVTSAAFSSDGKWLALTLYDMLVRVLDAATGEVVRTLDGHDGPVRSVAFSPDGKLLASASDDETVKVWDAATGDVVRTLEGRWVRSLAFDITGLYLLTDIGSIKLDDVTQVRPTGPIQSRFQARPQRMQWCGYGLSPDKSWITWNGHNALWLPPECRPSSSATWCSAAPSLMARVAIGCPSGRVIVIGFSGPPPGLPSSES